MSIIGRSEAIRRVLARVEKVAPSHATVLLDGETGTGKDLVAEAIHKSSPRCCGPFVVVDAGALAPGLIDSELFGHVKGAFTGAIENREGAFERAHGGTLFLDEIGDLPLNLQARLVRVLETGQVRRVGDDSYRHVDVRVVAASNKNLWAEVQAGRFRRDLYFRLAVLRISIPPLREHREDIPLLVSHFLGTNQAIPRNVSKLLQRHSWPGNVRELRNLIEIVRIRGWASLPEALSQHPKTDQPALGFKEAKEHAVGKFEHTYLCSVMNRVGGNVSAAARQVGMDRKNLVRLLRKHSVPRFRSVGQQTNTVQAVAHSSGA